MSVLKRRYNAAFDRQVKQGPKKYARTQEPMQIVSAMNRLNSSSSTTQQAMRIGGWANPSRGGELKFVDNVVNNAVTTAALTFSAGTLLNGLANGSDASTRIGRKITIKSLLVRWTASLAATSTGGSPVRILIVYDKQANATAPAITDILLSDSFQSQNNLSNRDRFVTLSDVITEPISAGNNFSVSDVIYKKLNLETMYNAGSAGTIGDITSGSIYLFQSQNAHITTASGTFLANCRVRYTDV